MTTSPVVEVSERERRYLSARETTSELVEESEIDRTKDAGLLLSPSEEDEVSDRARLLTTDRDSASEVAEESEMVRVCDCADRAMESEVAEVSDKLFVSE